jgi:hypothetical protein
MPGSWTQYLIPVVVVLVLLLRLRGLSRVSRLRLETLWIVPVVLVAALALTLAEAPPRHAATWIALAFAVGIGAGLGWRRASLTRLSVDPATHRLNQQSSPAALLFVVLLIVARQGLRWEAARLGFDLAGMTLVLLGLGIGLVAAGRAELFLRARALLAAARAGTTAEN